MKVVVISSSPRKTGKTQVLMKYITEYLKSEEYGASDDVKFINLSEGNIDYYRGPEENYNDATKIAAQDIMDADVWFIGTPIYNSFFSAALKNLFEYVDYKKTEGKVAGLVILASGNIGFTDVQTLLTQLMSYFKVITYPRPAFVTADTIENNEITSDDVKNRLIELAGGTMVLGSQTQRVRDLKNAKM